MATEAVSKDLRAFLDAAHDLGWDVVFGPPGETVSYAIVGETDVLREILEGFEEEIVTLVKGT